MDYAYRFISNVKYFYKTLNPASLSGAIDLIVVEQPDGSYLSTPFHVRFGKYGVLNSDEKYVDITVNGIEIDLKMKLGENGIAFFTEPTNEKDIPDYMVTSPVPGSTPEPIDGKVLANKIEKIRKGLVRCGHKRSISECSHCARSSISKLRDGKAVQTDQKKTLPYNASLFCLRKNRSLPNLTEYLEESQSKPTKKLSLPFSNVKRHSSFNKSGRKHGTKGSGKKTQRNVSISSVEDSDSDDGASTLSIDSGPSVAEQPQVSGKEVIADCALSDSELDHHRDEPEPNKNDVVVWRWGELPRTREEAEKAKQKEKEKSNEKKAADSSWGGWFRWSRPKQEEDQGVYLDDLMQGSNSDKSKIEKYLGKSPPSACPSPPFDSGNGSVGGHISPAISSDNEAEMHLDERCHKISGSDTVRFVPDTGRTKDTSATKMTSRKHSSLLEISTENAGTRRRVRSTSPTSDIFAMSDEEIELTARAASTNDLPQNSSSTKYIRSLRLSSEKLKKLGLRKGANEARFSITTKFQEKNKSDSTDSKLLMNSAWCSFLMAAELQGTTWCSCHIYLYNWTERLVISDIDGTITKSDVLGHVIPAIGGQWAHAGVAELFTRIKENGYQLVYLSSRAIGQSYYTKKYLQSITQDAKFLPDGPLLLSPTSVLVAFRREVIDRKPEEFKIAALSNLKECFPVKQPFYAGFGNRDTVGTLY